MALGSPGRGQEPLKVVVMAAALVTAAFVGAALGLAWKHFAAADEPLAAGEQP
jgi:hypothetical protein